MIMPDTTSAVAYHSKIAQKFHCSYRTDANRRERLGIWRKYIEAYGHSAQLAYDLGCGSGILACEVAKRGIETVAIDGSSAMLELAVRTAKEQQVTNITFLQHLLPLAKTETFRQADLILSSSVVEYLPSVEGALSNFRKLLRSQGIMIFTVANRVSISRRMERASYTLIGYPRYFSVVQKLSTINEIKRAIISVGMQIIDHEYCEMSEGINTLLRYLVPPKYASNMIIVVARNP
jgi:2-polyprenyl-3-methyl-5-hydroxy-6-metoxy-1,4-benzoquinol methylase